MADLKIEDNMTTSVYIIDKDFKILYFNDNLKKIAPHVETGQFCFEAVCNEKEQCKRCPLRKKKQSKSILFSPWRNNWINVSTAPINLPKIGEGTIVMCDDLSDDVQNLFYKVSKDSAYSELVEFNYLTNSYHIISSVGGSGKNNVNVRKKISEGVLAVAETAIHPDDRERFKQFWLIDSLGKEGIPEEMKQTRHAEFKKLRKDGLCDRVQQVFMPIRESSQHEIVVMNFYDVIETMKSVDGDEKLVFKGNDHLYIRDDFFLNAEKCLLESDSIQQWTMVSIDLENLKLYNELYGWEAGDRLIRDVGDCLKKLAKETGGIAGYFGNDDYAILLPNQNHILVRLYESIQALLKAQGDFVCYMPSFGVYEIADRHESIRTIYNHANVACTMIKGNYKVRMKKFDAQMIDSMESQYMLFSEIKEALNRKEFTFELQPKCNLKNGKIVGAEALARWYHKEKGAISPAVFIPVLEKTGYISVLDVYIWEQVCKWQRRIIDEGFEPVPVSVNVSREDMRYLDVVAYFSKLIADYQLPAKLIEIEITESASINDNDYVNEVVKKFRKAGFRVLMDDFGSGYSSLNMLKDIDVDVLKLDMRFLDIDKENEHKGIGILEAIHNMAHLMGVNVIAEGVETEEQHHYLQNMGCLYAQGYYFYRPMKLVDFEELLQCQDNLELGDYIQHDSKHLYLKDLLNEEMFSEMMMNNLLGAVAFYEVYDREIKVKRYNEHYAALLGNVTFTTDTDIHFKQHLYEEEYDKVFSLFEHAKANHQQGAKGDIRRRRPDGREMWLHLHIFFLSEKDGHAVYYSSVRDVTELYRTNEMLRFLDEDMPGGYYRHQNDEECTFTFVSGRFLDILGFTREEIKELFNDKMIRMIHPDDRGLVFDSLKHLDAIGGNFSQVYRIRSKNGYLLINDQSRLVKRDQFEIFQGIITCDLDYYKLFDSDTKQKNNHSHLTLDQEREARNLMPCGVFRAEADGQHQFSYISNSMLSMLGYSRKGFIEKFQNSSMEMVYAEDRERVKKEMKEQLAHSNYVSLEYRVELADGSFKWIYSHGRLMSDVTGRRWFYTCIVDYSYLKAKLNEEEWHHMKYKTLSEIPGVIAYDYDPIKDCISLELTDDEGNSQVIECDHYLQDIEKHGYIASESVEEQKKVMLNALNQPVTGVSEFKGRLIGEEEYQWYRIHYKSLANENDKVYRIVGRIENIHGDKTQLNNWKRQAMLDSLTGLVNNAFSKKVMALEHNRTNGGTMYIVDVDNFKMFNDEYGHLLGDEVLKKIAGALRSTFDSKAILSRPGGDEFIVFLPGVFDQTKVLNLAEQFQHHIQQLNFSSNIEVTCSIGVAISQESKTIEELMAHADLALHQVKVAGKNKVLIYNNL